MPRSKTLEFLRLFDRVKQTSNGWTVRCPVHKGGLEDDPSLDIHEGREGIVMCCRSHGCSHEEICRAVGWEIRDLFWDASRNGRDSWVTGRLAVQSRQRVAAPAARAVAASIQRETYRPPPPGAAMATCVAEHLYRTPTGTEVLKVRRFHHSDPQRPKGYRKACIPYHPEEGGWKRCNDCNHDTPLYNALQLAEAPDNALVAWVEGENKADALMKRGILATTALGGSSRKSRLPDLSLLTGKRVCILPDKDTPGEEYAEAVYAALRPLARRVWVQPNYPEEDAPPEHYDVVDWLRDHPETSLDLLLAEPEIKVVYKLLSVRELLTLPSPRWLVDTFIQESGLWLLFGESSHGKSFVAMDVLGCIARGGTWCGKTISQAGPVVYINADGGLGFRDRFNAWLEANQANPDTTPFYTLNEDVPIWDPRAIDHFNVSLSLLPEKPVCLVVDTYSRCIAGKDENNQGESSAAVKNLDALRQEWGCAVGLIHHTDAQGKKIRGSSVLIGAADSAWRVTRGMNQHVSVDCTKQRNGPDNVPGFSFQLRPVASAPGQVALFQTGATNPATERSRLENSLEVMIEAYPNSLQSELAEWTGLDTRRVSELLKSLESKGVIEHGPPRNTSGRPAFTYRIKGTE